VPTHTSASTEHRSAGEATPTAGAARARALGKGPAKTTPADEKPSPSNEPKAAPEATKGKGPEAKSATATPGPADPAAIPPAAPADRADEAEADADKAEKPEKTEPEAQAADRGKA
jgi:hypothetical protein